MRVIGFAGYSGAGKTTLIEQVIPRLVRQGFSVSLVKHAHHRFDVDQPGKDSWRHREAGATEVLLTSDRRWALMHELRDVPEPSLADHLARMSPCDFVLIEGFKSARLPKIEVHRSAVGNPVLYTDDADIVAIASDVRLTDSRPWLRLDDFEAVTDFVVRAACTAGSIPG